MVLKDFKILGRLKFQNFRKIFLRHRFSTAMKIVLIRFIDKTDTCELRKELKHLEDLVKLGMIGKL